MSPDRSRCAGRRSKSTRSHESSLLAGTSLGADGAGPVLVGGLAINRFDRLADIGGVAASKLKIWTVPGCGMKVCSAAFPHWTAKPSNAASKPGASSLG
jgi:hypothetical protein